MRRRLAGGFLPRGVGARCFLLASRLLALRLPKLRFASCRLLLANLLLTPRLLLGRGLPCSVLAFGFLSRSVGARCLLPSSLFLTLRFPKRRFLLLGPDTRGGLTFGFLRSASCVRF